MERLRGRGLLASASLPAYFPRPVTITTSWRLGSLTFLTGRETVVVADVGVPGVGEDSECQLAFIVRRRRSAQAVALTDNVGA